MRFLSIGLLMLLASLLQGVASAQRGPLTSGEANYEYIYEWDPNA